MNLDTNIENNVFLNEMLDNKRGKIEEILIKQEIKEETSMDENPLSEETHSQSSLPIYPETVPIDQLAEKGKMEEILIKEEDFQDKNSHQKEETKSQNEKVECSPSRLLEYSLSESNFEVLLCDTSGNLDKISGNVKIFKCTLCQYHTARRLDLQRHLRTHTGEKPFKCSSCPYQAARMGNLRTHERTHTGEKPFKCKSCSYQAADQSHLRRHMRTHTGERPFKCTSCPYQATQMESLRRHIRTIHTAEDRRGVD